MAISASVTGCCVCDSQRERHTFFLTGQTTYKSQLIARVCFVGAFWILQHNKDQKTVENYATFRHPECTFSWCNNAGADRVDQWIPMHYLTAFAESLSGCSVGFVESPGTLGGMAQLVPTV